MNLGELAAYAPAGAAILFVAWRSLGFSRVKRRIPALLAQGAVVVHVRGPGEYAAAHAPGSVNMPLSELGSRLSKLDANKPLVVCCASGARSAAACAILRAAGYKHAINAGPWTNTIARTQGESHEEEHPSR